MALNEKQKRFVDEYLIDLNGTQAAIRAGYSKNTARQQASDLLTNPVISAYIDEEKAKRAKRTELTQDWVLERLKAISDRCMTAVPVMEFDYTNKELKQKEDENGEGVFEFDSNGANRATELIGKHLGMFITKKVEHSGEMPVLNFISASQKPKTD